MFIFRWIRTLLALVGLITTIWFALQYFKHGSPLKQHIQGMIGAGILNEGYKDAKAIAGGLYDSIGGKPEKKDSKQPFDVTEEEMQKLNEILKKELGISRENGERKK